jgi:DNA-binding NtrC family response regulator
MRQHRPGRGGRRWLPFVVLLWRACRKNNNMNATPALSKRCVIWFGHPLRREREALAAAGWHLRVADPACTTGIGMRGEDRVVGLVDLRDLHSDGLAGIDQLIDTHGHLPLMAMISRRTPADTPQVERLLRECAGTFAAPVDTERMISTLDALDQAPAAPANSGISTMIGKSPAMRATQANIRKFAPVDLPVLITGETGTGKELAARALHELSPRRGKPFIAVNCGALPPNLVQSELFGHERGAFTGASARRLGLFESAAGGTVFLDEIGDLPLEAQTNLLRVLQEGKLERVGSNQSVSVDVRVLAATHVELEKAVAGSAFRQDLYYRLNVLRLRMPRLDERGDDILLLAQHFLDSFRGKHTARARAFSPAARQALLDFSWPGHVRELLNRVQRAAVLAEGELITPADLELDATAPKAAGKRLEDARASAERDTIVNCLRESGFNVSECARRLKTSRMTIYRLCKKYRLTLDQMR